MWSSNMSISTRVLIMLFVTCGLASSHVLSESHKISEPITLQNSLERIKDNKHSSSNEESRNELDYKVNPSMNVTQEVFDSSPIEIYDLPKLQEFDHPQFSVIDSAEPRSFPCPSVELIKPCHCSIDEFNQLYMNCSQVESEKQLAQVFQQEFPIKHFKIFYMANNDAIRYLVNSFNGITFREIQLLRITNLEFISQYWLYDSRYTLEYIDITYSKLHSDSFPFISMDGFTKLDRLFITGAELTWLPDIHSNSLKEMAFEGANISSVTSKTFKNDTHLIYINLSDNKITKLETGTFYLTDEPSTIHLERNGLSTMEPDTFLLPPNPQNLTLRLHLQDNALRVLDEAVLGPVFPYISSIDVYGNPLLCGCDVAWLITNKDYMAKVDELANCDDNTNLHDLDPQLYLDLC